MQKTRGLSYNSFQRPLLFWLGLSLCLSLLHCYGSTASYEGRISLSTLDPNKRPCSRDIHCNNLRYTGFCQGRLCVSSLRAACVNRGESRACLRPALEQMCVAGVQQCQPEPFVERVWGDCLLRSQTLHQRCDGTCEEGEKRPCYTGKNGCKALPNGALECTAPCQPGVQKCISGQWTACVGEILPSTDLCNGKDDDCDGVIDATPDSQVLSQACYSGRTGTRGVGSCRFGLAICIQGKLSACQGEQVPKDERCNNADDNCNGQIDETAQCPDGTCVNGRCVKDTTEAQSEPVPPDDPGGSDAGMRDHQSSQDSVVYPESQPQDTGLVDQHTPEQQGHEPGPENTSSDAGPERATEPIAERANEAGSEPSTEPSAEPGREPRAEPSIEPSPEPSTDAGTPEEVCSPDLAPKDNLPAVCIPFHTKPCYDGPRGTERVGPCRAGTQRCRKDQTWGPCQGQTTPSAETCNGQDDDCNGLIDDGPKQTSLNRACYNGPQQTRKRGACRDGIQFCLNKSWGPCLGQIVPGRERCNRRDDDCDGQVDEGCYE